MHLMKRKAAFAALCLRLMFYETATNAHGPRDPFKAIVAPRPIGWISTRDRAGRVNLAPYSFFNAICDNPKLVLFSSAGEKPET